MAFHQPLECKRTLNGEMDEFRIWSEERSSGDSNTYMSTHLNPSSFPTLAVNFDFNELTNADDWYESAAGITAPTELFSSFSEPSRWSFNDLQLASHLANTSGNTQNGANLKNPS